MRGQPNKERAQKITPYKEIKGGQNKPPVSTRPSPPKPTGKKDK